MTSVYHKAMDSLALDEREKQALTATLLAARESASAQTATMHVLDTRGFAGQTGSATRAAKARRPRLRLAAAAALAAVIGLGGIAYASGALIDVFQAADYLFNGAPANTEIVDKVGRPIGATATDNGVVISADAIIGDANTYTVVYSIRNEDGNPLGVPEGTIGDGVLPLRFEQDDVELRGVSNWGSEGSSWFFDADPTDEAVQFVVQRAVQLENGGSIIGTTVSTDLKNLVYYAPDGSVQPLIDGHWKIRFKLNYEDASIALPTGQVFNLNGMNARIDELSISPVSLTIAYTPDQPMPEFASESGKMSEEDSNVTDRFLTISTLRITFTDGTTLELRDYGSGAYLGDAGGQCQKSIIFDRIIDVDQIAFVEVNDATIDVA